MRLFRSPSLLSPQRGIVPPATAHERAILSLRLTIGADTNLVDTIDGVRRKRNIGNYERAGIASPSEAQEMYTIAQALRNRVLSWLKERHPDLYST